MAETAVPPSPPPRLYLRQLLSGRDFAVGDPIATQMVNFAYLVGDRETGEALLVDPAYAVADLLAVAAADGMSVVGALATHHHPDHVGGELAGYAIEGVTALLEIQPVPIHANEREVESIRRSAGISTADVVSHAGGDRVRVGDIEVTLLHTPGHTPGSQCFLVDGRLISGDTLFLDGCGRTDFAGGDPAAMYQSLQQLAALPGAVTVYPGHRYSDASSASMETVRGTNIVYQLAGQDEWLRAFGG